MSDFELKDQALKDAIRASILKQFVAQEKPCSVDEFLELLEGQDLDGVPREKLMESVVLSEEKSRALIDARRFPELQPEDPALAMTHSELSAHWENFRQQLDRERDEHGAEKVVDLHKVSTVPVKKMPFLATVQAWRGIAAGLFLTCLALSFLLLGGERSSNEGYPLTHVGILDLIAEDEGEWRDSERSTIDLAGEIQSLVLILTYSKPSSYSNYGLEMLDEKGNVIWKQDDARRDPAGFFKLLLPKNFLVAGRYKIVLQGLEASSREIIATYYLTIKT